MLPVQHAEAVIYGLEEVTVETPGSTPVAYSKLIPFISKHNQEYLLVYCPHQQRDNLVRQMEKVNGQFDGLEIDEKSVQQVVSNRIKHEADKGKFYVMSSPISEEVLDFVKTCEGINGIEVIATGKDEDIKLAQQEIKTWKKYRDFVDGKKYLNNKERAKSHMLATVGWSACMFLVGTLATVIPIAVVIAARLNS